MHSIMNTGDNLHVNVRDVVCLCPGCLHGEGICKYSDYVDEWRGFDMQAHKEVPVTMDLWNSVQIRKTVGNRDDYSWKDVWVIVSSYNNYDALAEYVKKNPLPFFDVNINLILNDNDRSHIDPIALHYLPNDAPVGFVPCKVEGDGNCFPRTPSFICFRNEFMHAEFCVCLLYESILNAKYYLSNRYLSRGSDIVYRMGGPVKQLAMYAENYNPNEALNVIDIYKKEVLQLAKDHTYCGLWQLCQVANILRRPIKSIYPSELHEGMHLDFNRTFYCIDNKYNDREAVVIMWTPMQVSANSYPIHFIPLLKAVSSIANICKIVLFDKFCILLNISFIHSVLVDLLSFQAFRRL